MNASTRSLFLIAALSVVQSHADVATSIVRDGTVGNPDITLQPIRDGAGVVAIGEDMGDRPGGGVNLFHSFTTFDVAVDDKALFTADPAFLTRNIISRVTGGSPSTIEGTLASNVAGAALYFLNPSGVVFGAQAHIEVPGALHIATAATLGMLPDDPNGALTFTGDARLAMAQPISFGFLGQPVALAIEGSKLNAATGSVLSLVGQDVRIGAGSAPAALCGVACLQAPGGSIRIAAVGDAQHGSGRPARVRTGYHRPRRHRSKRARRCARQSRRNAGNSRRRRSHRRRAVARGCRGKRCSRTGDRRRRRRHVAPRRHRDGCHHGWPASDGFDRSIRAESRGDATHDADDCAMQRLQRRSGRRHRARCGKPARHERHQCRAVDADRQRARGRQCRLAW